MEKFVPIEIQTKGRESELVLWYVLIRDAEAYRERTGWGLANVWGAIHERDYPTARALMDNLLEE